MLLLPACGDDEEARTGIEFGETQTRTAVIQVNGIEVLTLREVHASDRPTRIPVKLRAENAITIRINNDRGEMHEEESSYPCWGTFESPWKNTRMEDSTYSYLFSAKADPDSISLGTLIVAPRHASLSIRIDYETGSTGPVFSGPHQYPFVCRTERAALGQPLVDNGDTRGGLGVPVYGEDEVGEKPMRSSGTARIAV